MKPLGECLVFYLKYPNEMKKLEEDKELEGLENREQTKKMADRVALASQEAAAEFLHACGEFIAKHFSKIGNEGIAKKGKLGTAAKVGKEWSLAYGIWPVGKNKPATFRMKAGVSLELIGPGKCEVVPWLWHAGGEQGERTVRHVLQGKCEPAEKDDALDDGYVALARITLLPALVEGFDVDCEPILQEVDKAFQRITKEDLTVLYPK